MTAENFLKENQEKEGKDYQRMYPYSTVIAMMKEYHMQNTIACPHCKTSLSATIKDGECIICNRKL